MSLTNEQLEEFRKLASRDVFAGQVNSKFQVNVGAERFETVLTGVSDLKTTPAQESFSLIFQMPENFPAEQGIYRFENTEIGNHEIFVVPIGKTSDGFEFQAVYNLLLPNS